MCAVVMLKGDNALHLLEPQSHVFKLAARTKCLLFTVTSLTRGGLSQPLPPCATYSLPPSVTSDLTPTTLPPSSLCKPRRIKSSEPNTIQTPHQIPVRTRESPTPLSDLECPLLSVRSDPECSPASWPPSELVVRRRPPSSANYRASLRAAHR